MNLKAVTPLGAALIVTFGCSLALLLENLYLFGYHLDLESAAFLGNYLADRSLPELVFDPARNDWKLYQARELSYFFDCLDARFIGWSIRHGWCQFYTLSGFLMLTAAVFVQQYGIRTLYPKLPGVDCDVVFIRLCADAVRCRQRLFPLFKIRLRADFHHCGVPDVRAVPGSVPLLEVEGRRNRRRTARGDAVRPAGGVFRGSLRFGRRFLSAADALEPISAALRRCAADSVFGDGGGACCGAGRDIL